MNFVAPANWDGSTPPEREGALVWEVGALVHAVSDMLTAKWNPVTVKGELSGFSRAASGHCYFNLKDAQGSTQLRCAMFRKAASAVAFSPKDGDMVEVKARLGVYEARGDLQLVVDSMRRSGQGSLFEQFMLLKARLEAEGLFDATRKRDIPAMPRGIGLVTSQGAAALQDVTTALARRVPHIPVQFCPASVQGEAAVPELVSALNRLYDAARENRLGQPVEVILLVRGGGSLDDLWSFNDERLVRTIAQSPVPLLCGVGHETDFTLADFAADLRAPTPTAAAELCATSRDMLLHQLDQTRDKLDRGLTNTWAQHEQRLDRCAQVLARTSLPLERARARLERAAVALRGVDPLQVLQRGYAWLHDAQGKSITHAGQLALGQQVQATLAEGEVDLSVLATRPR